MKKKYKTVSKSNQNKSDSYSARRVSLSDIENFLRSKGYHDISLQQYWRHVHGTVSLDGQKLFFKLASTPGIGRATRNETRWNKAIGSRFKKGGRYSFFVPQVYHSGQIEGCFYYISEHIQGRLLWEAHTSSKSNASFLKAWIPRIARAHVELLRIGDLSFVWDSAYKRVKYPGRKFFKRAIGFHKALDDESLTPVLEIAREIESLYVPGVAHGDSTPWHMIAGDNSQFAFIDAEWACTMLPRYYDIAYFYHRLYTMTGQRKLSREFLKETYSRLSAVSKRDFERRFPPVLAERVLGGFWDVTQGGNHATGGKLRPYLNIRRDLLMGDLW